MKFYHGTNQEIDSFKHGVDNKGVTSKYGFWFTDSIEEAHQYGKNSAHRLHKNQENHDDTIEKYLTNIKNAERNRDWDLAEKLTEEMEKFDDNDDTSYYIYTVQISVDNSLVVDGSAIGSEQENVIKYAIDKGYDSVIFKNISDSPYGMNDTTNQIVVFDSNDIEITNVQEFDNDTLIESVHKFKTFLKSFRRTNNHSLIEAIIDGFNVLFESTFSGKELIVVDIQPEYQHVFGFKPYEFTHFLNEHYDVFSKITLLYNGEEMGMISESEYINWLIDNGLDVDVIEKINFFEKGYAFFRNAMDNGIDHDEIVHVVAFMAKHDINDSRMLDDDLWDVFRKQFPQDGDIVEYLQDNEDSIFIPELIDELDDVSRNPVVTGGGSNECLAEVLIVLKYLGTDYQLLNEFVY